MSVVSTPRRTILVRLDRPRLSLRIRIATVMVLSAATLGVLALLTLGVGSGDFPITIADVIAALAGQGDERSRYVVWDLRVPRLLGGALIGVGFAISGLIFQGIARNPLVAPDVIGINGGAAVGAVGAIVFGLPSAAVGPAALVGAAIAGAILFGVASSGNATGQRLVLVGIGLAAVAEAGIGFLLTRGDMLEVRQATIWLVGSLYATSWSDVALLLGVFALLLPVVIAMGPRLLALQLGDDVAIALGVRPDRARVALIGTAIGFSAVGVAAAGPIGFVAFLAPNVARRLARTSGSGMFAASAAIGALLVLGSDIVARRVVEPAELPVGIVTALLGGPYFLALLLRADRVSAAA